jgi:nucleoid DNA-binding protein/nucleoid-associated protein YgaU
MNSKINLSQLADLFAQISGLSKTASEQFVKAFFDIISQGVLAEGLVKVKGLGTFKLLQMEDRESVNVNTGERFTIEGHQKISFTPDAELKERINKPFAVFETVEITAEQAEKIGDDIETGYSEEPQSDTSEISDYTSEQTDNEPKIKDITQKRSTRVLLKLITWVLSLILLIGLVMYILWPIIGCKLLTMFDDKIAEKAQVTTIVETKSSLTSSSVTPEQSQNIEKPLMETEPIVNKNPESVVKEQEPEPAVKDISDQVVQQQFNLNREDMAKSVSLFTEADTVNYRITGKLAVHTVQNGETLAKISFMYYGTKKLWPYIAKYNKMSSFNNMGAGSVINIPKLAAK